MITRNKIVGLLLSVSLLNAIPLCAEPCVVKCKLHLEELFPLLKNKSDRTQQIGHEISYYFPDKQDFNPENLRSMLCRDIKEVNNEHLQCILDTTNNTYCCDINSRYTSYDFDDAFKQLELAQQLALSIFNPGEYGLNSYTVLLGQEQCESANAFAQTNEHDQTAMNQKFIQAGARQLLDTQLMKSTIKHVTDYTNQYMHLSTFSSSILPHMPTAKSAFTTMLMEDVKGAWLLRINDICLGQNDPSRTSNIHNLLLDTRFLCLMEQDAPFKEMVKNTFEAVAATSPEIRGKLVEVLEKRKTDDKEKLRKIGRNTDILDFLITHLKTADYQSYYFQRHMLPTILAATVIIAIPVLCGVTFWLFSNKKPRPTPEQEEQINRLNARA